MSVLNCLQRIFLWPGDVVRRSLGINIEEDGVIIRSFVNMVVWGIIGIGLFWRFV